MVSADGTCRPFDDDATGTVFGDGVAIVALKRLADAVDDRRPHLCRHPRHRRQQRRQRQGRLHRAERPRPGRGHRDGARGGDVDAGSIGYVECHGTATPLGDPIELAGLQQGFGMQPGRPALLRDRLGQGQYRPSRCRGGRRRPDQGGAGPASPRDPAARQLPPPNRHIDAADSPFYFPTTARPWTTGERPRRAGVSSFGVGGTNVHAVLEEAPQIAQPQAQRTASLRAAAVRPHRCRAAHCGDRARRRSRRASRGRPRRCRLHPAGRPACLRAAHRHRRHIARAGDPGAARLAGHDHAPAAKGGPSGLHVPWPGCAVSRDGCAISTRRMPLLRALIDPGIEIAAPIVGDDLRSQLLDRDAPAATPPRLAQPALFIFDHAQARLWMEWGLQPDAMVGHSVGEFVAACLAGVFSFERAAGWSPTRARLMQALPPGAMLAVRLPEQELQARAGRLASTSLRSMRPRSAWPPARVRLTSKRSRRGSPPATCRTAAVFPFPTPFIRAPSNRHWRRSPPAAKMMRLQPADVPLRLERHRATGSPRRRPSIRSTGCATARAARAASPMRSPQRRAMAGRTCWRVGPGRTLSSLAPQIVDRAALRGVITSMPEPDTGDLSDAAGRRVERRPAARLERRRATRPIGFPCRLIPSSAAGTGSSRQPWQAPPAARPGAPVAPALPTPCGATSARIDAGHARSSEIFRDLSGVTDIDPEADFIAQGFDLPSCWGRRPRHREEVPDEDHRSGNC